VLSGLSYLELRPLDDYNASKQILLLDAMRRGASMYSLFVSGAEEAWTGDPFRIEHSRCVREYTKDYITNDYGQFTPKQVEAIKQLPSIFAYEAGWKKNPKFGKVLSVKHVGTMVEIKYELIPVKKFLKYQDLEKSSFDLGISKGELNRTHWAIKEVDLPQELAALGIQFPSWKSGDSKIVDITTHQFDIALSFPGKSANM
jgi:hypothetical protein